MGSPRTRRKRATAPDLMALANGYESQLPSYGNIPYDPGRNREAQSNGSSTVSNAPTKDDMEIYISNQSEAEPIHRLDSDMIQDMDLIKDNLLNCLDEVAELREKYYSESLPSEARYIAVLSAALRQWALHCQKNISDDDTILTYVLGDRPNQYQDRELGIDTLEPLHRSVTSFLSHRCGTEKICLYLADMSTVVDKGNGESSDVTMDISLRDITDLDGRPFMKNGIRLNKDSVIQSGSLDERYSQNIDRQNPYPTPSEEVVSIPSSQSPNIYHDRVRYSQTA